MRDADSARSEYLRIAIDGRSSHGAEAWLRLSQLDIAAGQPERASEDLARLRSDYPTSPLVPASWYWSGRALESAGDLDAACTAWGTASASARDSEYGEVLALSNAAAEACGAGEMRLALQLDAFRERSAAEAVAARAEEAGFAARIVQDEGLYKVRVGRFGSVGPAREMARRLRAAGFSALITADNR
jgi:tetratricopeptide (TPR) repeat protein